MWQTLGFAFGIALSVNALSNANAAPDGVVKLDTYHRHLPRPMLRRNRNDTASTPLLLKESWAVQGSYFVNVEVGTPPQKLELALDSGSDVTWVPNSSAPDCKDQKCPGGTCMS